MIDALLADPLVEDIQTLTTINELVGERRASGHRQVPYIFVAPPGRDTIGQIARDVFRRHYGGLLHAHRSPQLAFLGRLIDAGADPLHGELLSYLFFAPEFARALIERGRKRRARRGWTEPHDDGLWDTGPLGRRARLGRALTTCASTASTRRWECAVGRQIELAEDRGDVALDGALGDEHDVSAMPRLERPAGHRRRARRARAA